MFKLKVYYEDTDSGGVVYYANYLKFLERARTEILYNKGFSHKYLKSFFDILVVVKTCKIDFIKPAKLDDVLEISTSLIKKSKVQVYLNQEIYCQNILLSKSDVRIAFVNTQGKIVRIPSQLYDIF